MRAGRPADKRKRQESPCALAVVVNAGGDQCKAAGRAAGAGARAGRTVHASTAEADTMEARRAQHHEANHGTRHGGRSALTDSPGGGGRARAAGDAFVTGRALPNRTEQKVRKHEDATFSAEF